MSEYVLPRIRTRRRRKRPMPPFVKVALAFMIIGVAGMIAILTAMFGRDIPDGNTPMILTECLGLVENGAIVVVTWPIVAHWIAHRDDD